ncbi:MAG: hypothetical protein R3F29_07705 [Planctomycetota bacterium]
MPRGLGITALFFTTAALTATAQQPELRLEPVATYEAVGGVVHSVAFSPDGKLLATAGENGDLRVVEFATGHTRWKVQPSNHWSSPVVFSPDGTRLACRGRHLTIHEVTTGRELLRVEDASPGAFAWCDDERFAYGRDRRLVVRDGDAEATRATFEHGVHSIARGADGELWVGDGAGRVWRVPAGDAAVELVRDHSLPDDKRCAVTVAFVGGVLLELTADGRMFRGELQLEVPSRPFGLAASGDGRAFAAGGASPTRSDKPESHATKVRWWTDGGAAFTDIELPDSMAALAFHPDGARLYVSTYGGQQALHQRGREPIAMPGHPARVRDLAMTPDGTMLAMHGSGWTLQPLDGRPARALPDAVGVQPGRSGAELVVQYPGRAVVLDTRTGEELACVPAPRHSRPRSTAMTGPGELLLIDHQLVDRTGKTVAALDGALLRLGARTCASSVTGAWAVGTAGGFEGDLGALGITDANGAGLRVVEEGPIHTIAFSPDGKRLYYSYSYGMSVGMGPPHHAFRVRDVESLKLLGQTEDRISCWRFLDAKRALVVSRGQLQVWDVERLTPIQSTDVRCYTFLLSDDRRTLVAWHSREVAVYRILAD